MKKSIVAVLLALVIAAPAFGWGKHHKMPKPLHKNAPHPYTKHQPTKHPKVDHPHRVS